MQLWPDFRDEWVVYQDDWLLVVDKPAGVPAQAAEEDHDDDLPARVRRFLAARRGVPEANVYLGVHQRLDRDTSGLVLFTLQPGANPAVAAQFQQRSIEKTYLAALSAGPIAHASTARVLTHRLSARSRGRVEVVAPTGHGQDAQTHLIPRKREGSRALIELKPRTGRTHQLRVQLAHEGSPIAGDTLYGGAPALRLLLHASQLRVRHPTEAKDLELAAPAPIELLDFIAHGARDVLDDPLLLRRALSLALERRYRLGRMQQDAMPTSALRLFNESGDGSRRLAIDLYMDHAVVHLFEDDARPLPEEAVLDAVQALGVTGVYLKRHPKQKNDLVDARDPRYAAPGPARGQPAPEVLVVHEYGVPFEVRLGDGLRTGLFLDQRENRRRVREVARDRRVLNLFAYTGGFSVASLAGGAAQATCVDTSASALQWAERNVERIGATTRHRTWRSDAFEALARSARRGEHFDLVVLDPPSYSNTRTRRFVAARDYAALCEACLRVLAPGGLLLACINHHGTRKAKLRADVLAAARAVGRALEHVEDLAPALDFPPAFGAEPSSKSVLVTCR